MNNAVTKEGASLVEVYRANNTYMNVSAEIEEMQSALTTDLETHIWNVNGTIKKALKDASGSSNTPASRVFFSDSEGAASSDSVLIYDSINKKLGIGVSPAIGAKLHLHQASTANALMKLSNTTTGSGEHNGLNIGVVGDSYVVRTQYARPIVVETENPSEPGQYLEIAKFQKTGSVSNTILNSDLKVNTIVAKSTAASVFLTHEENTIKTRTAAQVLGDIGAASAVHVHAIADITSLQNTLDSKQPLNSKLTAISNLAVTSGNFIIGNGSTFVSRKLQNSDLPAIAITDTFVVNSQAAMLALSTAERGDVAVRTDLNKSFILRGDNPASLLDWQELLTPTDAVLSVDGRTGVVSLSDKYQPLDADLTAIAGLSHTNRHVMISNGTSWTRRALAEDDLPSLSISKITNLQTALDDKQSTITGTGNKVLSIQADGTGVKTGSIYDGGNVVQFEKAFIGNSSSAGIRHYHDVYLYSNQNVAEAGILKIVMPQGWTNTFQRITIKGYNYRSGQGAWECIIGGYNYNATNDADDAWVYYSAEIRGSAPFSIVRLGYDGSKCVILLGTTETSWRYAKVAISDMLVGGAIYNWETGWHASIISSETGLTKIATPTVNSGVSADWNALINKPTGTTNHITMFTNGATGAIGNSQLLQSTDEVTASKGFTSIDYLQSMGPLYTRSHIYLINKAGNAWLNFATRDVSGSEAKFRLSNIADLAMEAVSPFLTITPYSNGGIVFNTPSSPSGQHAHWITRSANDGVLRISREVNGESSLMMAFAPSANEILFDSDIYFSHNNLFDVCLSGEVKYNGISIIKIVGGPIDTDNCPGIYLDPTPSSSNDYTLTSGVIEQRIFVRNGTTHVQYVDGCRIEPGEFRDFLKTGTGWTASGASISGKTLNVGHGTGDISVSNVSTVHINFTPTSTYTMTNGYVGQRVTVVVLSGSAQHWIQGATKAHKIIAGEFRDFIYTTAGWVASAADY